MSRLVKPVSRGAALSRYANNPWIVGGIMLVVLAALIIFQGA